MKKQILFIAFFGFFGLFGPCSVFADPFLRIVQPFEGYDLPAVEQSFVFGSVLPATSSLTINGKPVVPHTNGAFLTMIPFEEGRFEITAVASDGVNTTTITRHVNVAALDKTFPDKSRTLKPITPTTRVVLRPGDLIPVSFQGPPGGTGSFRMGGRGAFYPVQEQSGKVEGIYSGSYRIQPNDKFDKTDVVFFLKRKDGKKLSKKAGARITVQRRKIPRYVKNKEDTVILTGPGASYGYHLFVEQGIQLEVTGEWGEFSRVALGRSLYGWVKKSVLKPLPVGTPPVRSITRNARIETTDESTRIEFPLKHRHAHRVEQTVNPHRLYLTLYGVTPDTDRIRFKSTDSIVKEMNWVQDEPQTVTFDIQTKQKYSWGYDVRFEDTNLILEIRHAPPINSSRRYPLKGLRIALDAGHSKNSFGTIGPWGNTEASVNLLVAERIKTELEKAGAEIVMIQNGTREPSLTDRVEMAWRKKAHMFISLHCDATGEGKDPRDTEGFSVHYYHPQSRMLAEILHKFYNKNTGITDQGVWRSNLAVCRMTEMPSVLIELAYLILPEEEERLLTKSFHKTIAETFLATLENYLEKLEQ